MTSLYYTNQVVKLLFGRNIVSSSIFYRRIGANFTVVDPPISSSIKVPEYKERTNETDACRRARLLYQSRKRGMLENGLLLSTFAAKFLDKMTNLQLAQYDKLINKPSNDWDLYYWATGLKPTPEEYEHDVMGMLKEHTKNLKKESRIRQPDLYQKL